MAKLFIWLLVLSAMALPCELSRAAEKKAPDYNTQVAPLLKKYCAGCHNADDREGEFSVETFAHIQAGGEHGPAISPGSAASSRLLRLLTGDAEPRMPPEDSEAPTAEEIELLKEWVDGGAAGPDGAEPDRTKLNTPHIKPWSDGPKRVTGLAWSPDGAVVAVARFAEVELQSSADRKTVRKLGEHPGKVNCVRFSKDGSRLVTATGIVGLYGKAMLWDAKTGELLREFQGHRDTVYAAELSPDGKFLATGGYDRKVILWNVETGEQVRQFPGHNDAIYDLAFHPDGSILATASGDHTVKIWLVATGERLDTLSQPLKEQYAVTFSPDGEFIAAGGVDNRIRIWRLVSRRTRKINPLVFARFAHEGPVVQLKYTTDGAALVSAAEDRTLKLWETRSYTQMHAYESQPDIASAVAIAPAGDRLLVGRMNGQLQEYSLALKPSVPEVDAAPAIVAAPMAETEMNTLEEKEPNDAVGQAMAIAAPATIKGVIHSSRSEAAADEDVFRFSALAGQQWVMEIKAARDKSPLDSHLEVVTADGAPIPRVLLRAVRDSYFTFRGKDSNTADDFRVHNWREMELNEYLFSGGEVVKLWLYPRGPDSGFKVYPGEGNRHGYFDTTPLSHALNEPCYIVEPHAPGSTLIPNGLPVFPLYYENDDDSKRRFGADSRLAFTAPADGDYLVRVSDVRGQQGPDYKYELTVRPRRPDFTVAVSGDNPTVNSGSGKEFHVRASRMDDFDGDIRVDISSLPPGFTATSPLIIEAGHDVAFGVIRAAADAPKPTPENAKLSQVVATAMINGMTVSHDANNLGEIKLADPPKLRVTLLLADEPTDASADPNAPLVLVIAPGETITARVRVERIDFKNRISFGNADAGRNLPHGVFVDNIGLNGLMIVEGQTERKFFITAAKWVPEMTREFHLRTTDDGGQTTQSIILHVRPKKLAGGAR